MHFHTLPPTAYTLHPTPYTLNPTPYTLQLTPYTLHPAPYTLHPYTRPLLSLLPIFKLGVSGLDVGFQGVGCG